VAHILDADLRRFASLAGRLVQSLYEMASGDKAAGKAAADAIEGILKSPLWNAPTPPRGVLQVRSAVTALLEKGYFHYACREPLTVAAGMMAPADEIADRLELGARDLAQVVGPAAPDAPTPNDPTLFRKGDWDLTESGYAAYKGTRFPLNGRNRRLLARLILGRGRAVHADHLIDFAEMGIGRDGLRTYVCRLRKHLQKHLPGLLPADPIPHCDPDAYQLAA
jgi:hypothetical protein